VRNVKQLINIKQKLVKQKKLFSCDIHNINALAKYQLNSFVRSIDIHPEIQICLGHDAAFELANRIAKRSKNTSNKYCQEFSYDTTFGFGLYLSVLSGCVLLSLLFCKITTCNTTRKHSTGVNCHMVGFNYTMRE
jgi:hypothetical protein